VDALPGGRLGKCIWKHAKRITLYGSYLQKPLLQIGPILLLTMGTPFDHPYWHIYLPNIFEPNFESLTAYGKFWRSRLIITAQGALGSLSFILFQLGG